MTLWRKTFWKTRTDRRWRYVFHLLMGYFGFGFYFHPMRGTFRRGGRNIGREYGFRFSATLLFFNLTIHMFHIVYRKEYKNYQIKKENKNG